MCRSKLKEAKPFHSEADKAVPTSTWSVFKEIMENFKPVMRRFFTETWEDVDKMFESRLLYTRSVAVNSMVGYVLGLGDRHVHNILIDNRTAELIHIDLGIAFNQGQLLPTPEVVPFRLTRDIVDGMGVMGIEGVFRRCCEATLRVLRGNVEPLVMLLEVFLHDPLFTWRMNPDRANVVQNDEDAIFARAPQPIPAGKASFRAAPSLPRSSTLAPPCAF
jgi:ataxia telangiectasia mutated family protein